MLPDKPDILYEDNHLLVVNKPAGLLTQPDKTGQPSLQELCRAWIKVVQNKPGNVFLEPVHRLDKPVSGIVLFAKTSKALSRLNAAMRAKKVRKVYLAKLTACPPQQDGTLVHYLVHGDHKAEVAKKGEPEAKEARLHYKVVGEELPYTIVEVELETGRYHQIRAQFAAIGCPLAGDSRYGAASGSGGIGLHHACLEVVHPTTGQMMLFRAQPSV